jgi:hypothetical protein
MKYYHQIVELGNGLYTMLHFVAVTNEQSEKNALTGLVIVQYSNR